MLGGEGEAGEPFAGWKHALRWGAEVGGRGWGAGVEKRVENPRSGGGGGAGEELDAVPTFAAVFGVGAGGEEESGDSEEPH